MERRGLEKSQGKSGLRSPHCAAEASSHSHTVPWEAERLPFLPGKRKEGKLLWSGKGVDHGPAGWEGEVRSQQRDPRGPEETGGKDRAPWQQPQERLTSIQDYP